MSLALVSTSGTDLVPAAHLPPVLPWRDPHGVSPAEIALHIARLEQACLQDPRSADLRTCLGMAHAVNYDVYKSMDALEHAVSIDPRHFWAQMKYAELHYRVRALPRAQEETIKALALARNPWELSCARRQLQEIRSLLHHSTRNITWNKPLTMPVLALSLMFIVIFLGMWR